MNFSHTSLRILPRTFYDRDPKIVARDLIGNYLIRVTGKRKLIGQIVETEAYLPEHDPACHSFRGRTKRNESMFKEAGHAYVYTMHRRYLFNIVTEDVARPGAVLIRALEPTHGLDIMKRNRGIEDVRNLTSGPGKLCDALSITKAFDGTDITDPKNGLYVAGTLERNFHTIVSSPRVGISKARDLKLRFFIKDNGFVSKARNGA